ncbi:MAG: glucose-6-phosphate isomerase [Sulfurimonas sp.]|nr:glucose-6-phosphate isomerase [Sulfurimonas sp.]MBU4024365.1 glucose-6-phosphate isomerase [bacterium]MBU4058553.1 glucose-6-phosphate isomerase [bacterium]MBU4110690.1 glucose-6-phosphate isomerase [bacterium]
MSYHNNFNPTISDEELFSELIKEKESDIGYYNLVHQDTAAFKEYAKDVKQNNIVVIGIGGSTLGTYAIYKFLKHSKNLSKNLYFLETTDPIDIKSKLRRIDLEDTLFIVISKSGTTVETVSIFKYINSLVTVDKNNTVVITEYDSKLNFYAQSNGMKTFEIPKDVGGRFSVFTAVGLLPLAIVGIDIDELLAGTKDIYNSFFNKELFYERILRKARFFTEYKTKFNVNVVFSYSSRLEGFNKWYIQLWGESLGKMDCNFTRQGITPIGIIGPIDQHSFLQLIVGGTRDKTVTVIKLEDFDNHLKIPAINLAGLEELNYLDNVEFSSLINMQADATIESINSFRDIPCDVITITGVNERAIASLMYEYELLTSACAKFMYINAYDQPGVESGKIILKEKLAKK